MKKGLLSSIMLALLSLSTSFFQNSCKKDFVSQTTKLNKEQILVSKTWKVDRLHHVISGQFSEYQNGGVNTTGVNYDNLRFTFNTNGTGTHIDASGTTYPFTWKFPSKDFRSLQITVSGRTDTWEMLEIADNYLHASVNLILYDNSDNIESFRLIQVR